MRELFKILKKQIESGNDCELVSIIASSGSTPRGAGARMLISNEGRLYGTIGGGAVEFKSEQMAIKALEDNESFTHPFILRKNEVEDLGMICGGGVTVHFLYISGNDEYYINLCEKIEELYEKNEAAWLVMDISAENNGKISVFGLKSGLIGDEVPEEIIKNRYAKPCQIESGGKTYYIEKINQAGNVYIFGGGHVAQALVPVLASVDFNCIVLEDREDFCQKELFKGVDKTILIDVNNALKDIDVTDSDYVCIMTRGHKDDFEIEYQILQTPAKYIGVIGSAKKTAGVNSRLKERGITDDDLRRVYTPIGLNIKAQTPAEIAISIAGEMIEIRATATVYS